MVYDIKHEHPDEQSARCSSASTGPPALLLRESNGYLLSTRKNNDPTLVATRLNGQAANIATNWSYDPGNVALRWQPHAARSARHAPGAWGGQDRRHPVSVPGTATASPTPDNHHHRVDQVGSAAGPVFWSHPAPGR